MSGNVKEPSDVAWLAALTASYRVLINAFASFDVESIQRELEARFEFISMDMYNLDYIYMFLAGSWAPLGNMRGWNVMSECGAGNGIADIIIDNHNEKFTIIFEFKQSSAAQQTKQEVLALEALKEIHSQQYYRATNEAHRILAIGCVLGTSDITGRPRITMRTISLAPGKTWNRDDEFTRLINQISG